MYLLCNNSKGVLNLSKWLSISYEKYFEVINSKGVSKTTYIKCCCKIVFKNI